MDSTQKKKTCFVIMGFGVKTDFQQQKSYDLDKSYRIIIKKAVEAAGLECIRHDDLVFSGVIDKPLYQRLLDADLVVADLSTSNANAIYELGVRHALRPCTTIVIAEKNFKFPFDIGHLMIRPYNHLGTGIDAEDAEHAREELTKAINELIDKGETDSPVYEFLHGLREPTLDDAITKTAAAEPAAAQDQTASLLLDMFYQARSTSNWSAVMLALTQLKLIMPNDPFVVQQLALATYKAQQPDLETSLAEAKNILAQLDPQTSTDPETLGIWGAIHKRLWETSGASIDLDESIRSYGKGFNLKDDHYNGINFSFMLNVRASVTERRADAIADFVWAERVRRRVIELCEQELAAGVKDEQGNVDQQRLFWLRATLIEALVGTGQTELATCRKVEAIKEAPEDWMSQTLEQQLEKLETLLADSPTVEG